MGIFANGKSQTDRLRLVKIYRLILCNAMHQLISIVQKCIYDLMNDNVILYIHKRHIGKVEERYIGKHSDIYNE